MTDWISINDRLPPLNAEVICWNECSKCRHKTPHAHSCVAKGFPDHGAFTCALVEVEGEVKWNLPLEPNVTHWMPLPDGPSLDDDVLLIEFGTNGNVAFLQSNPDGTASADLGNGWTVELTMHNSDEDKK